MTPAPPPMAKRLVPFVVIALAAFVTGLSLRGFTTTTGSRDSSSAPTAEQGEGDSGPGPREVGEGVPVGFEHSEQGAEAAAVAYVFVGGALLDMAPTRAAEAVRTMAAEGSADSQVEETLDQLAELRSELEEGEGPIRYDQAVLATRVDAFTPERARVSVWSVGVLARADVVAPQAGWRISSFELIWEADDWKVWSETITPGPAPSLNAGAEPATFEELDHALAGFGAWGQP